MKHNNLLTARRHTDVVQRLQAILALEVTRVAHADLLAANAVTVCWAVAATGVAVGVAGLSEKCHTKREDGLII